MTLRPRSRLFLALAGAAVASLAVWLAVQHWGRSSSGAGSSWLWDGAEAAGLEFRMRFLPGEQGETFKINLYDHGAGLAVGDYDGDGDDDVYFLNQLGPNALYRNRGDGTFQDVTRAAGVALGDRVCVAAAFADYDADGDQDLYVTSTRGGNVLFRNRGRGHFEDVTRAAGVGHVGHSQGAVFFDADGDGRLDLFVANTARWTLDDKDAAARYFVGKGAERGLSQVVLSPKESNVLYRNRGDGTFVDVTEKAGLGGRGWAGDAAAFDCDGDGDLDLFVTCMFGRCQLYRNDGKGAFEDVTLEALGKTPWGAVGARPLDYDNDGDLDLVVLDMHSDMWMGLDRAHESLAEARSSEKLKFRFFNGPHALRNPTLPETERELGRRIGFRHEEVLFGNALYRNEGGGRFTEVSDKAGAETFWPWGAAAGDLDNDGSEDLFVPSGMGYPFYYWPNALLMNNGDGTFADRAAALRAEPPAGGPHQAGRVGGRPAARSSRAAATADFDGDGRLEVVTNNFHDRPYYLRNRSPRRHHVSFRLRGWGGNRDAVGALVRLYRGAEVLTRQVQGACGYLSQSSRVLHFGLGDRPGFDRVEVAWPGGARQRLGPLPADITHTLSEPPRDKPPGKQK